MQISHLARHGTQEDPFLKYYKGQMLQIVPFKIHTDAQTAHAVRLLQFWQFIPHEEQIEPLT